MKKVVVAAFALASLTQVAKAQTGSVLVGGNIDFTSSKASVTSNTLKNNSFDFNPTVGYQFDPNWTAGIIAEIGSSKSTSTSGSVSVTSKSNKFGIGPFVRYAKSLSNTFAVYGQLQGLFGSEKSAGVKTTTSDVKAFPAIFINVKNGFGLNFNIGGIEYGSEKISGGSKTNSFNLNFGKEVGIGISKNFGGMKENHGRHKRK